MSDTPTRFPLAWPFGRSRLPYGRRKSGKFTTKGADGWQKPISVAAAMDRLEAEVRRLGGVNTLLSTNLDTRLDGRPRSDRSNPADPGAALYFTLAGKPMAMACDAFYEVAQNIAALAAHIEATRAIERYGVATAAETLQAFQALPSPPPEDPKSRPWREVFELVGVPNVDVEYVQAIYRVHAKRRATDTAALAELNVARDEAISELAPRAITAG